ncbi:superoxide dismutase [Chlorella sorokiniana]|uniref:superoxide dismutase n=1 Tax=Chlorella sorokiniana TaxID=3076 RepID=A0A2P6U0Q9_CHLSO|nr:superoxide dismutase [Chlorella sorokiniana]|eukprot:PRW59894.1 superoxide dismutase [Chlorella sorokiniana]
MKLSLWLAVLAVAAAAFPHGAAAQNFTLPSLPYETDAFEPSIDNMTMTFHWTRHTNAFVTNLNSQVLVKCPELNGKSLLELVLAVGAKCNSWNERRGWGKRAARDGCLTIPTECETLVRNNAGGFWNHGLFFLHNLAPAGTQKYSDDASEELQTAIWEAFSDYDTLKANFSAAAAGVFGSGWAWLVTDDDGKLSIVTTPNQDNPLFANAPAKGWPILGLDVWEHAYYLKYYNVRASYIAAFFDVINWKGVSAVYAAAKDGSYGSIDVLKPAANFED